MDLKTLKAEHPALVAQIEAEGVEKGVSQERERVSAHITMGDASGDMKLAISCISEGVEHTAATNAKYMAAQMNKKSTDDRAGESVGDIDTDASDDVDDNDKAVASLLASEFGVEING